MARPIFVFQVYSSPNDSDDEFFDSFAEARAVWHDRRYKQEREAHLWIFEYSNRYDYENEEVAAEDCLMRYVPGEEEDND